MEIIALDPRHLDADESLSLRPVKLDGQVTCPDGFSGTLRTWRLSSRSPARPALMRSVGAVLESPSAHNL